MKAWRTFVLICGALIFTAIIYRWISLERLQGNTPSSTSTRRGSSPCSRRSTRAGSPIARSASPTTASIPRPREIPAPVILSRVAMSSFLREAEHAIFYAEALLAHWAGDGAPGAERRRRHRGRLLQGPPALADRRARSRRPRDSRHPPPRRPPRRRGRNGVPAAASRPISAARARASSAMARRTNSRRPSRERSSRPASTASCCCRIMSRARGGTIMRIETLDRPIPLRDRGRDRRRLRSLPGRRLRRRAGPCGRPDDRGDSARGAHRGSRADRPGGRARRRRRRVSDRRPRRRRRVSTTSTPCRTSSPTRWTCSAGTRMNGWSTIWRRRSGRRSDEVRLLDAGLRRLAAQRPRRGDGGELGLCAAG